MRIDLGKRRDTLEVQGNSVLIDDEESLAECACVFLEDATKVAGGELSKVRRLELELTEALRELKVMAMR